MGRLARKEGSIKVITLLLLVLLLVACSPIIRTTGLVHSIVEGNAFGTVTGVISSIGSTINPESEPPKKKTRAEIMEDLRKALER